MVLLGCIPDRLYQSSLADEEEKEEDLQSYTKLLDVVAKECAPYENVQLIRAEAFHDRIMRFCPTLVETDTGRAEQSADCTCSAHVVIMD